MKVMRDTVNGAELVAEVEVPVDCTDVNAFLETLPSLGRQRRHVTRQDSTEHYDNLHVEPSSVDTHVLRLQANGGTMISKVRFISARSSCTHIIGIQAVLSDEGRLQPPESGKAVIFRANAEFNGQKPAVKNEFFLKFIKRYEIKRNSFRPAR